MKEARFAVPGATLYYEVRGSGPTLLLIPGSGGDAGIFDGIADPLAEHFTVVATDPRGSSRSVPDDPASGDRRIAVLGDDAHRLLEHLTPAGEDAYVFGTSGGGVIALDLLARHPGRVHRVVVHEPPCFAILPDAADHRAMVEEVLDVFRAEGPAAAGARFAQGVGITMRAMPNPDEVPARTAAMIQRLQANAAPMFAHELRPVTSFLPDATALARVADRLVVVAGEQTRGQLPYRSAEQLAAQLELPLVEFPGGHGGVRQCPEEFAKALLTVLTTPDSR